MWWTTVGWPFRVFFGREKWKVVTGPARLFQLSGTASPAIRRRTSRCGGELKAGERGRAHFNDDAKR